MTGASTRTLPDAMSMRKRKGMLIKNTNARTVQIDMATRTIILEPGEEELVTAEEVLDEALRDFLQVRGVSIVRPARDEEEAELRERLS
jgi:hypothetical protein